MLTSQSDDACIFFPAASCILWQQSTWHFRHIWSFKARIHWLQPPIKCCSILDAANGHGLLYTTTHKYTQTHTSEPPHCHDNLTLNLSMLQSVNVSHDESGIRRAHAMGVLLVSLVVGMSPQMIDSSLKRCLVNGASIILKWGGN